MTSSSSTKRTIPINDLGGEYTSIQKELAPVLDGIFRSGFFILGSQLANFEKELAGYIGVSDTVGVGNGTDAVMLALKALGIGPGDEVIVPAMTFFATVEPIVVLGATPVFVDIDPVTYALDPGAVTTKISSRTKAIIAVHLYGHPADLKALSTIAKEKKFALIEDMAQAIGSAVDNKKVGTWGDMAALSFFPTKNLGACGDAGAVLTSNPQLADRVRSLRNHGAKVKYHHEEIGWNSRLDEIQAAILRVKLKHLDVWNEQRRTLAALYNKALHGLPLTLPIEAAGCRHVYHLYSVQSDKRDALKTFLQEQGITTGLHYPLPLHTMPALKFLGHQESDFPVSAKLAKQTLSLPLYPSMPADDVQYVADAVRRFFQSRA